MDSKANKAYRGGWWLVMVVGLLGPGGAGAAGPKTLAIGSPAPDFELPGIMVEYRPVPTDPQKKTPVAVERTYRLKDFAEAKILAIIFTCNHCPTAQAYEGRIKKLTDDYREKGVAVVCISPNDPKAVRLDELGYTDVGDSFEDMKIRAVDQAFNFPYLYDGETQKVSRAYGPVSTPHVFIFDGERQLRYVGRIDNSERIKRVKTHEMRAALEALLAGKDVAAAQTRTMGCSIKWSDKRDSAKQALARWDREEVTLAKIDEAGVRELMQNKGDKLRLINMWATWCPSCVVEIPEFVEMHRMYRRRAFELVTVSADDADLREKAHDFLKKQHASCTNYLFDAVDKYKLIEAVDPKWQGNLPYTVLVAPGGKVLYRVEGIINPLKVKQAIVGHLGRIYQ